MTKDDKKELTEAEKLDMAAMAKEIERGLPQTITICGKAWKMRPISKRQLAKISNLAFDVLYYQREMQKENISLRRTKSLNNKIRQASAKQAAYYVLGRRRWLIPFAFAWMWRKIYNQCEEVSATINSAQTIYGKDKDFYIANLENLKFQLALSTRQVGDSDKQKSQRTESAESMVEQDGLPKKEGNK